MTKDSMELTMESLADGYAFRRVLRSLLQLKQLVLIFDLTFKLLREVSFCIYEVFMFVDQLAVLELASRRTHEKAGKYDKD